MQVNLTSVAPEIDKINSSSMYVQLHNSFTHTYVGLCALQGYWWYLNIRTLPKHKGELVAYLSNLPLFDILVLTEIGSRNIDLARNLLPGYNFMYVIPTKNTHGGVGLYWKASLSSFMVNDLKFTKTCDCPRCEIESLVVDFTHQDTDYTLCSLYRHPNGNGNHFTNDLERLVAAFDKKKNSILTGDININLIHYDLDNVQNYITTHSHPHVI